MRVRVGTRVRAKIGLGLEIRLGLYDEVLGKGNCRVRS